jgi:hypothetical protein
MSEQPPEFRKLPLRRVIFGAFSLPWLHRGEVFRATAIPLLAVIACTLVSDTADFNESRVAALLLIALYGIATSWLAIAVHRLVLLDAPDARARFDMPALRRLAVFFGIVVSLWVLYQGLTMLISGGILGIFMPPRYIPTTSEPGKLPEHVSLPVSFEWIVNLSRAMSYWIVARVTLMLPAIAIDRKADLIAAWSASRRNGWRLAIIVGVLPWCLQQLTNLLYRDGATLVEFGILLVLATLFVVVEVVALSLSYWELTSPAPQPTHPPA